MSPTRGGCLTDAMHCKKKRVARAADEPRTALDDIPRVLWQAPERRNSDPAELLHVNRMVSDGKVWLGLDHQSLLVVILELRQGLQHLFESGLLGHVAQPWRVINHLGEGTQVSRRSTQ